MKFSFDDERTDTKIPVDANDVHTVLQIFERVRDVFATSALRENVELVQCRFAQNKRSGPVTMHFKCVLAIPLPNSTLRSEIEFDQIMDWQEGGIQTTVRKIENSIIEHVLSLAGNLRDTAERARRKP